MELFLAVAGILVLLTWIGDLIAGRRNYNIEMARIAAEASSKNKWH